MAAEAEARRRGADDAVFVRDDGIVLEGPVTNVWWRRGDTLSTPSLDLGILAGVTRARCSRPPPAPGTRSPRARSRSTDLLAAEEVFTSSSVREVMPAVSVDGTASSAAGGGRAPGSASRTMAEAG